MKALIEIETNDSEVLNAIVKQLEVYNCKPVVKAKDADSINAGLSRVIKELENQVVSGYDLQVAITCNEVLKTIQSLLI